MSISLDNEFFNSIPNNLGSALPLPGETFGRRNPLRTRRGDPTLADLSRQQDLATAAALAAQVENMQNSAEDLLRADDFRARDFNHDRAQLSMQRYLEGAIWDNPGRGAPTGLWEQLRRNIKPKYTCDHWRFAIRVQRDYMPSMMSIISELTRMKSTELTYSLYSVVITGVTLYLQSALEAIPGVEKVSGKPALELKQGQDVPGIDGTEFQINVTGETLVDLYTQTRRTEIPLLNLSPLRSNTAYVSPEWTYQVNTGSEAIALYQQLFADTTQEMRDQMGIPSSRQGIVENETH